MTQHETALRTIRSQSEGLVNALALVCGSKAVPARVRKPLEAVLANVNIIRETADLALADPAVRLDVKIGARRRKP